METRYLPYCFENGPNATREEVMLNGANCQWLIHEIYRSIGIALPPWMRSAEIYNCTSGMFVPVARVEEAMPFDISMYGRKGADPESVHLGVCEQKNGSDPPILHMSFLSNGLSLWPHTSFLNAKRYSYFYGIRRYNPSF
ncbi:hypothetical protein COU88_01265 [Candidatus Roizmanbacteria bacterium CG10_big_fil_rev_8_21_14_0_10_39_6]|uniref:NlpC/P60 domain-containing protein n=1 Tax=Candidatus Roizmanbacteria bacterium CG10_big_fil_rev_8_21_14_0_10_39_6 TaxID=1974853 RepID=A0A2M8KT61_9BACT|nr:MAG: hypothetical protein COU88_01265 [Candidatus Roizmanbacteria bacterium CG10_big_fil_rev_8_21_14_0_10_39_6]